MASGRLSLRTLIFAVCATLMIGPGLVAGTIYTGRLQARAEAMLVDSLKTRGEMSAGLLARRLHQLWQEVESLSRTVNTGAIDDIRRDINFVSRTDRRYSWIGVTDVEGKVLAAKEGMLEGVSVAQRPWFRRGLTGPTAIDVHEAQLLAKLLPAAPEPYRFIDLAAPLQGSAGAVQGVIGAHLDWRWVVENLTAMQAPGIDVLLISRDRNVLFGPPGLVDKPLAIGAAEAANRADPSRGVQLQERWPDGRDYVTVIIPAVGHADLPSFGWSLLVRQDAEAALAPTRSLVRDFWIVLGVSALIALALLFAVAAWVTTPLRRLAGTAEAMVTDTAQGAPYRETRYDEASRLSAALVKIQSRLAGKPAAP